MNHYEAHSSDTANPTTIIAIGFDVEGHPSFATFLTDQGRVTVPNVTAVDQVEGSEGHYQERKRVWPTDSDEGRWYELMPNSAWAEGTPERYRTETEAHTAAAAMLKRDSALQHVEIIHYEIYEGERSIPHTIGRVEAT